MCFCKEEEYSGDRSRWCISRSCLPICELRSFFQRALSIIGTYSTITPPVLLASMQQEAPYTTSSFDGTPTSLHNRDRPPRKNSIGAGYSIGSNRTRMYPPRHIIDKGHRGVVLLMIADAMQKAVMVVDRGGTKAPLYIYSGSFCF